MCYVNECTRLKLLAFIAKSSRSRVKVQARPVIRKDQHDLKNNLPVLHRDTLLLSWLVSGTYTTTHNTHTTLITSELAMPTSLGKRPRSHVGRASSPTPATKDLANTPTSVTRSPARKRPRTNIRLADGKENNPRFTVEHKSRAQAKAIVREEADIAEDTEEEAEDEENAIQPHGGFIHYMASDRLLMFLITSETTGSVAFANQDTYQAYP
jgi:hypothetical protein